MNERIKKIRQLLGMTQEELAGILQLQRNTISLVENGKRNLSPRTIDYLCEKLNVNKSWLLNGSGNIFKNTESFSFDEYAKSQKITDDELEIIKCYLELDPAVRRAVISQFKNYFLSNTEHSDEIKLHG